MLTDLHEGEIQIVERAKEKLPDGVLMRVRGPFGVTEEENRNKRIYRNKLWEQVLKDEDIQQRLKERAVFGEADHPQTLYPALTRVSHITTNLWLEKDKNEIWGEADVLDTPSGRILETLFRAKGKIGISSRGAGGLKTENGKTYVNESDYKFGGFDFVVEPSATRAYPQPVVESVEKILSESRDEVAKDLGYYTSILQRVSPSASLVLEGTGSGVVVKHENQVQKTESAGTNEVGQSCYNYPKKAKGPNHKPVSELQTDTSTVTEKKKTVAPMKKEAATEKKNTPLRDTTSDVKVKRLEGELRKVRDLLQSTTSERDLLKGRLQELADLYRKARETVKEETAPKGEVPPPKTPAPEDTSTVKRLEAQNERLVTQLMALQETLDGVLGEAGRMKVQLSEQKAVLVSNKGVIQERDTLLRKVESLEAKVVALSEINANVESRLREGQVVLAATERGLKVEQLQEALVGKENPDQDEIVRVADLLADVQAPKKATGLPLPQGKVQLCETPEEDAGSDARRRIGNLMKRI